MKKSLIAVGILFIVLALPFLFLGGPPAMVIDPVVSIGIGVILVAVGYRMEDGRSRGLPDIPLSPTYYRDYMHCFSCGFEGRANVDEMNSHGKMLKWHCPKCGQSYPFKHERGPGAPEAGETSQKP